MYLTCPACTKRLQIPDDKMPTDHPVRVTCPSCQHRFAHDPRTLRLRGDNAPAPGLATAAAPSFGSSRPALADPTVKQALVCMDLPEHQAAWQQTLQVLGYAADVMPNQFKALEALREVPYHLFMLDAAFDGTSLDTNLVLTFLRERPLEQRRYQFVVLCAPDMTTADPMLAYSQSVNLVVNHADVLASGPVLAQHLAEHELLYRTFREMRQQLGREV